MRNSPALNSGWHFRDLDGGSGLIFSVASRDRLLHFGAGRCSWYPQNSATASTLASDKHFASSILREAGVPALGGEYFFLHDRHRAHRPAGHERSDAIDCFRSIGRMRPSSSRSRDRAAISRKPFTAKPRWFAISMTS